MRKRLRLITGDQAIPSDKPLTKACSDCPFGRTSLPGWVGSIPPEEWIALAHGEGIADCHTVGNQQCAGLAIYRANVCKSPRNPNAQVLPPDRVKVFANPQEFITHHRSGGRSWRE